MSRFHWWVFGVMSAVLFALGAGTLIWAGLTQPSSPQTVETIQERIEEQNEKIDDAIIDNDAFMASRRKHIKRDKLRGSEDQIQ